MKTDQEIEHQRIGLLVSAMPTGSALLHRPQGGWKFVTPNTGDYSNAELLPTLEVGVETVSVPLVEWQRLKGLAGEDY